jgi:hypothetical protein
MILQSLSISEGCYYDLPAFPFVLFLKVFALSRILLIDTLY